MKSIFTLPRTLAKQALFYWRKLWVRVVLMGTLSVLGLGVASLVEDIVPKDLGSVLAGSAVDRLLNIIANAMLAVTIFSLTVMVSVYRSSSSQWTPRIHRLIIQDATTQNTLATFIGTYVYALVAIVLRETGVFSDDRSLVLFAVTVLVLCFIVFSLIRWVLHLQTLGSLLQTTRQVEDITSIQFKERLEEPCLGACPLIDDIPSDAVALTAQSTGYLETLYPEILQEVASQNDLNIFAPVRVGDFVMKDDPVLWVHGDDPDDECREQLQSAITLSDLRSYEQDPRFGLMVLGEIGSKALSPGINDPGTAIDIITRIGRVLMLYASEVDTGTEPEFDRVHIPPMRATGLIDDALGALARDGAHVLEVQMLLQRVLSGLSRHPEKEMQKAAREQAQSYLERALAALDHPSDADRLKAAVKEMGISD